MIALNRFFMSETILAKSTRILNGGGFPRGWFHMGGFTWVVSRGWFHVGGFTWVGSRGSRWVHVIVELEERGR
jgi:hypothetical protein